MKLRYLLFVVLLAAGIIPTVLFEAIPHSGAYEKEIADVSDRHLLVARNIGLALERYDRDTKATFKTLVINMLQGKQLSNTHELLASLNFRHICIVTTTNRTVIHSLNEDFAPCPKKIPAKKFQLFLKLTNPEKVAFSSVLPGPDGTPLLYLVWTVGDKMAVGAIQTDYFVELGKSISFGKRGHAAIVDHTGKVLSHPLPKWRHDMKDISRLPPVQQMLNRQSGVLTFYSPALKDDMIAGFTWVKGAHWGVMIPQPVAELKLRAKNSQQHAIDGVVSGGILAALLSWLLAGYLTKPVLKVVDTARQFSMGVQGARVPRNKSPVPKELKDLAETFNSLADSVDQAYGRLSEIAQSVSSVSGDNTYPVLVSEIARILAVDHAYFAELIPDNHSKIRTVAFVSDGIAIDNFEYELFDTPCNNVVGAKSCIYNGNVQNEFPNDQALRDMGVSSYVGIPLFTSKQEPIGLVVVMSRKPMQNVSAITDSLQIFANRLASEWQHQQSEDNLRTTLISAEQANKSKSVFLANMSHELRTPLNSIIGFSATMKEQMFGKHTDPKYVDYSHNIFQSGQHLLSLISDILDVSKIEAGEASVHETDIAIPEIIQICVTMMKAQADAKNVLIEAELPPDLPVLHADSRQLKQIILNLLSNAVKFTLDGGIVRIIAKLDNLKNVQIAIEDNGIGIGAEDLQRVLEPFGRVQSDATRTQPGTGLGLPLSKKLVELHGGFMVLTSELGKGTVVTITFPASRAVVVAATQLS